LDETVISIINQNDLGHLALHLIHATLKEIMKIKVVSISDLIVRINFIVALSIVSFTIDNPLLMIFAVTIFISTLSKISIAVD
jgi:hypothetical protein